MPALQNIVLTDRTPVTPVNHTLTPRNVEKGNGPNGRAVGVVGKLPSDGSSIGETILTISGGKKANGNFLTRETFYLPAVQTLTGSNGLVTSTVVDWVRIDMTMESTPGCVTQFLKDALGMFQSSLDASKPLTNDVLVGKQGVYGG